MKKVMFMVVATMLMATTLKAEEKSVNVNNEADFSLVINQNALDRFLVMNDEQKIEMRFASRSLAYEVKKAKGENAIEQSKRLRRAVCSNLLSARRVLDRGQYRDYVTVLNCSLNNKGLAELINNADLAQK